ncbi:MAG: zinc-ribbon domain-containing protein [bacterium]|nr:zinc-ribbon domain-containing protein [bacterium]
MRKATKENNLKILHPDVAEEWHPTKNGELTPEQFLPGSGIKVWWLCKFGHEWRTDIYRRSYGGQCPYCLGMYPSKDYNLQQVNPELASQWHPTKNNDLTPSQVTPGSEKKVWWKCEKGHEWDTAVYNRKTYGCPECALINSRGKRKNLTLEMGWPDLVEEWHTEKNGKLTPANVTYGSNRKVWWICEAGHEWLQQVKVRVHGQECPYCSGFRPSQQYNLRIVNPEVAKQWHPTKNGSLTPEQVTPGSEKYIWWVCEKGHVWDTMIYERNNGSQCPYCLGRRRSKVISIGPILTKQWHPTKNGQLNPDKVPRDSNQEVWWKCEKGHEWKAGIIDRKHGQKCPDCSNRRSG